MGVRTMIGVSPLAAQDPHQEVVGRGAQDFPRRSARSRRSPPSAALAARSSASYPRSSPNPTTSRPSGARCSASRARAGRRWPPGEEGQDVAGQTSRSNCSACPAPSRRSSSARLPDPPAHGGVVLTGHLDQVRVEVDADDVVAGAREIAAEASAAATGVEDPCPARRHRVEQARLRRRCRSRRPRCAASSQAYPRACSGLLRTAAGPEVLGRARERIVILPSCLRRPRASRPGSGPRALRACPPG